MSDKQIVNHLNKLKRSMCQMFNNVLKSINTIQSFTVSFPRLDEKRGMIGSEMCNDIFSVLDSRIHMLIDGNNTYFKSYLLNYKEEKHIRMYNDELMIEIFNDKECTDLECRIIINKRKLDYEEHVFKYFIHINGTDNDYDCIVSKLLISTMRYLAVPQNATECTIDVTGFKQIDQQEVYLGV